jgi:hypothetical protein
VKYNELSEQNQDWARARNGPRLRIGPAEFCIRVKGVKRIRQPVPGEIGWVAGNGRFGFSGKRFRIRDTSAIITTFPDGENGEPYNRRGRKKPKLMISDLRCRQPIKGRKSSGGVGAKLTNLEIIGIDPIIEKEKIEIVRKMRKGHRRRTQKNLRKAVEKNLLVEGMKALCQKYH